MYFFLLIQYSFTQLLHQYQYEIDADHLENFKILKHEIECINLIDSFQNSKIEINRDVLFITLENQWMNCSEKVITYFNNRNIDLYTTFQKIKLQQKKLNQTLFEKLTWLLPQNSAFLNIIEPCYLWGQNMTHVLLKIKFTTKIDVPSSQQINRLNININAEFIFIEAYSFDNLNRYILNIKSYKLMNPNFYNHKMVELGQVHLEILKSPSPYFWKNIHSNIKYNPKNQYIWWDIYYTYRQQLEIAFGLLEDAENQREEDERKEYNNEIKLKQSNKRLFKIKEENQELKKQLYCSECHIIDGDDWYSWVV